MKIKIKIHPKADIEFIIRVIVAHWIYLPATFEGTAVTVLRALGEIIGPVTRCIIDC